MHKKIWQDMMWRMALIIFGNISGATKTENRTRPRTRALPNENDGAPENSGEKSQKKP